LQKKREVERAGLPEFKITNAEVIFFEVPRKNIFALIKSNTEIKKRRYKFSQKSKFKNDNSKY
jgi:hypothetical protein